MKVWEKPAFVFVLFWKFFCLRFFTTNIFRERFIKKIELTLFTQIALLCSSLSYDLWSFLLIFGDDCVCPYDVIYLAACSTSTLSLSWRIYWTQHFCLRNRKFDQKVSGNLITLQQFWKERNFVLGGKRFQIAGVK